VDDGVNLTGRPLAVYLRSGPSPDGWQESGPLAAVTLPARYGGGHDGDRRAPPRARSPGRRDARARCAAGREGAVGGVGGGAATRPTVDELERQRAADRWAKANAYSNALAATMANATTCGHRSSMPGRCVYAG
jgi:hypothetical protein